MSEKLAIDAINVGDEVTATFLINPVKDSGFRFRTTHLDGKQAPKVVLSNDRRIRAGVPCRVRITAIRKPNRTDRGSIEVEFLHMDGLKFDGVYVDPIVSKKLQVLLESGLNILLDGPQGCGKTVLARAIAEQLGLKFVFFNCGAVVEATDFLATLQVRASDSGQPITDFIPTDLLTSLIEATATPAAQYLVFLDEFNRCPEHARNALMPALDTTRRLFNPIENTFLSIPDNVQFIAAVNRGNQFSGTFGIDAAQLDRFAPLQMDYLPVAEEVNLLAKRHPELARELIQQFVTIANKVRTSADLQSGLSVRATEEACIYLKHPLIEPEQRKMLPEILRSSFCARFAGRWDDPHSEAGLVWSLVESSLKSS